VPLLSVEILRNNAEKYPADKRYARSAKLLAKLASQTAHLSDESWQAPTASFSNSPG
jgi:hypothetical protein